MFLQVKLEGIQGADHCAVRNGFSEFDIGVLLSNREFTEDAIKMRKYEPYLLNDNSILSRIALLELGIFGEHQ